MQKQPFELRVLGPAELRGPAGTLHKGMLTPKRLALLAYLAVETADGYRRRDQVVAIFWPELTQEAARTQLRKAVGAFRESLGAEVVLSRGEGELRLNPDQLWCDAAALSQPPNAETSADAITMYRGEFLDGLYPDGVGQEFHDWLAAKRKRLREQVASAAWACARAEEDRGDRKAAAVMARRALALTPDDEEGVRRLIAILDRHGDRAGALRVYQDWCKQLQDEYGVEPAPETRKLARKVQAARKGESHETPPTEPALTSYLDAVPAERLQIAPPRSRSTAIAVVAGASLIVIAGLAALTRDSGPPPNSVGIQEFAAIGGGTDAARAVVEELIVALSNTDGVVVRTMPLREPVQSAGAPQADSKDVAYILAGGVQTGSGVQRITMRLSRTSDGSVVWAASYDIRVDEMALQGRVLAKESAARISDRVSGTRP